MWHCSRARALKNHSEDPLTKLEVPTKSVRTVRVDIERCTTSNGNEAIPKGCQVIGSIFIQLVIINNDLRVFFCCHNKPKVRKFYLMNKLVDIPYNVMHCVGTGVAQHQRTWRGGLQHMISPKMMGKPSRNIVASEEWSRMGRLCRISNPIQAMVNDNKSGNP